MEMKPDNVRLSLTPRFNGVWWGSSMSPNRFNGLDAPHETAEAVQLSPHLLPDLPLSRIQYVGNTSIWGAKLGALSSEAFRELHEIRKKTTYYDLLGSTDYVEQFRQAMFLPHTNIELFPSLHENHEVAV